MTKEMDRMHILICGGGIAGMAAAAALADSHKVTVLEKRTELRESAFGINVKPNASPVVALLGIRAGCSAQDTLKGVPCCEVVERSAHDGVVRMKMEVDAEKAFGAPWLFCRRDDLHRELVEAARRKGVEIILGACASTISQALDGSQAEVTKGNASSFVTVKADDGREFNGDVALIADGIHSKLRSYCLPDDVKDGFVTDSGQVAFRALVPWEDVKQHPQLEYLTKPDHGGLYIWAAKEQRLVVYPCPGAVNIVAIVDRDALLSDICVDDMPQKPSAQMADNVRRQFASFDSSAVSLLSCLSEASLWPLLDIEPLPRGGKGNVFLIGDAAHAALPHQGQGASLAFEDAEALSVMLSKVADPSLAGKAFHTISVARRDRVQKIQQASRVMAKPANYGAGEKGDALRFSQFILKYKGIADLLPQSAMVPAA